MKLLREPLALGLLALSAGAVMGVSGVYLLAGAGWSLVAASVAAMGAGVVLVRGGDAEQGRNDG